MQVVGTQIINARRLPIYELQDGRRIVEEKDSKGRTVVMSVEGAKAMKNGPYPLFPSLSHVLDAIHASDTIPLALRSQGAQDAAARVLLRAIAVRLLDTGAEANLQ